MKHRHDQRTAGEVYAALTDSVGGWWDPAHTFSHDARNLSLDAKPGGCFCERLPDGGGVQYMRVVYASPDKLLRLAQSGRCRKRRSSGRCRGTCGRPAAERRSN